jgi:hypothetical protein
MRQVYDSCPTVSNERPSGPLRTDGGLAKNKSAFATSSERSEASEQVKRKNTQKKRAAGVGWWKQKK